MIWTTIVRSVVLFSIMEKKLWAIEFRFFCSSTQKFAIFGRLVQKSLYYVPAHIVHEAYGKLEGVHSIEILSAASESSCILAMAPPVAADPEL